MPKEGDSGARLVNGGLELVFVWHEDRFSHRIEMQTSSSSATPEVLTSSTESEGFETPVFQEVHQQGDLVFASGMSGDRHWSASVEPTDEGLLFDVACRLKSLPQASLGSVYTDWDKRGLTVIGKPAGSTPPPLLETTGDVFTIAAVIDNVPMPTTFRYRYAFTGWSEHGIKRDSTED